mgnify:CR=1 FL=1
MGLLGILAGLGFLVWLSFRGWRVLILAPVAALGIALVGLFVLQNVFELPVSATPRATAASGAVAGSRS